MGSPGFHMTARELQTCTFQGSGLQTPPKFNEKTPRETQKEQNGGGKGKNKSEILGGPAEGGPVEGGSGGRSREVQTSNNHNNQEQQRQTQNKWGRERPAPSPK